MAFRAFARVGLIALWFCGRASAGQQPESPATAPKISAAGQVLDPAGKPVAGARVVVREWSSLRYSDDVYQREIRDVLAETTSDADGRFQFVDVQSRPFRSFGDRSPWDVVALAEEFAPGWVHLAAADSERDWRIQLHAARTIRGRLVDSDDKPVAGCNVLVGGIDAPGSDWHTDFSNPTHLDLWRSQLAPQTTTDADGRFELAGLPADKRLTLVAQHPDFIHHPFYVGTSDEVQSPVEQASISNGARTTEQRPVHASGFTEKLDRGGRLSGRVLLADSRAPVPQAKVSATWQNRYVYEMADNDGRFEFTGLRLKEGPYYVSSLAEVPGYLSVREQITFPDGESLHEVALQLPRGETVRGSIVDETTGTGVGGVGVRYVAAGDQDDQSGWSAARPATTDASGRFEIVVPPGRGMLQVYGGVERHLTHDVPDHWRLRNKQSLSPTHSARVEVIPGTPTEEVQLKVGRGLVIRGRVLDTDGQPIFSAVVRAADRFGRKEREKQSVTDDAGRFELAGFPPHEALTIEIVDADRGLRSTAKVAEEPHAGPSRTADFGEIKLRGTGTVVGTVLGDGKPLAGARVALTLQVERDGRTEFESNNDYVETDAAGRFRFETVEAGKRVSAYTNVDGYTSEGTRSYTLSAGQELEIPPIELKSRGTFVAGIVVSPDGKPVAGATVSAMERSGSSISFARSGPPKPTGPDGRFRINDLPNVQLQLLAYIQDPNNRKGGRIPFPARVNAEPGQTDVRIVLDPKLQRPLP